VWGVADGVTNTDFLFVDGIAVFRPVGRQNMRLGVLLLRGAIERASALRLRKLMIVITEVTGFEVPTLAMRSSMVRELASAASGDLAIAIVCRPEFIDPQKFGIKVATSLGMVADVFETEDDALLWLRELG
jgi:hypothetical protein